MDEGFLIQIVKKAGETRLSPEKKAEFRQELELAMAARPLSRRAPVVFAVPDWLRAHGLAFACTMAGVAVIVSGTGVSLAAERSLPGDRLYPVKTEVNERLREAFLFAPEAKIAWEMDRVERRLTEADELSSAGRLADDVRVMIENDATEHAGRAEELSSDDEKEYVEERIREMLESRTRVKASFEKRKITISEREEGEHDEESEPYDDEESDERERYESKDESERSLGERNIRTSPTAYPTVRNTEKNDDKEDKEASREKKSSSSETKSSGSVSSRDSNTDADEKDEDKAESDKPDEQDEDTEGSGGDESDEEE